MFTEPFILLFDTEETEKIMVNTKFNRCWTWICDYVHGTKDV